MTDADSLFLGTESGNDAYREAVERASAAVVEAVSESATPYSGASPTDLDDRFGAVECLPDEGQPLAETVEEVGEGILSHSVGVADPSCVAHLHCPPLVPALAAETAIAATNQSLDSWDQSPAATHVERRMVDRLCDLFGYGPDGDGVFTSGGTQSNFEALLLARNWFARERFGRRVEETGLPHKAKAMRILCSEAAHFTAKQAAAHLGLGENAVVTVPTDGDHRMDTTALDATLADLRKREREPFALVGTAGTTDFGSIDPLDELADRAERHDLWFHVDAAYGGALALSETHREKLDGIQRADSLSVDFHKLFYQPISCGALLLRDGDRFDLVERSAAYLNPEDADLAAPNLVSKSVQTTRRFDALKPYVTFRTLGRERLAELVDSTLTLADEAAALLADAPDFEVLNDPTLNAVVFRYRPGSVGDEEVGPLNAAVRAALLRNGDAVVGRTEVRGTTALKFTLLNPKTTVERVADVLDAVRNRARTIAVADRQLRR
ncbi:aspartate aminotransferase family protein [Halorussus sp. MSC15.2]|uniref:pyridoxal phosphate-dependent decarboxylase family protein n=1 Tax=Halorussus sp. MSC15.2 TaxID=2283638 RepID=UPI0013D440B2|nr:aspartate aminotransferase family protein [Halorussus sp. MSC15.2]NEU57256.1 aspartate aminotransferase family protein [Halorussus sp. MSC15.2]